MKKSILRFPSSSVLSACFFALLSLITRLLSVFTGVNLWLLFAFSSVDASPQPSNDVHFCLPLNAEDMRARDSIYAATKHALNLNVGEPRTVRMIYFLPNDRPFRQEVVDSMKVTIRQIQTFYAEQMQAHGNKTFRFETDARGEPLVHRVDGLHSDSYYLDDTYATVSDEIRQVFDILANNVYLVVIDNSIDVIGIGGGQTAGGTAGILALIPGGFHWKTAAHELGHTFGLAHDFRDGNYIMSYGPSVEDQLSSCSAGFLAVHPYFNLDIPDEETPPIIELISPHEYPVGSKSISIQLKVSDPEGLHQVVLFVRTREPHFAAGSTEVKLCHRLSGEREATVEFDYDGVIPSDSTSSLSDSPRHEIFVSAIDTDGSIRRTFFLLIEISPPYITTLEGHTGGVLSVGFSSDGTTLASGAQDSTIKLWDIATKENIATLRQTHWVYLVAFSPDGTTLASGVYDEKIKEWDKIKLWDVTTKENIATLAGHTRNVRSVAFSPDGAILASGSEDKTVKLWDIVKKENIATLENHTAWVSSVAFSPDGAMLASGSGDKTVKLWDVATRTNIATLRHTAWVTSVAFSPDGTMLASGLWGGNIAAGTETVWLWDVLTRSNTPLKQTGSTSSVAFSPDGTLLAIGNGLRTGTILWDVTTQENIVTLEGHTSSVSSVAFSPDGTILASGSDDHTIILWDMSALGLGGASQDAFSLSLDGDGAAGDQAVTSLDVSPGAVVSIQVFGKDIQDAEGFSIRFEYDETQVLYEGFDLGDVLPNAQAVSAPNTGPNVTEIWIGSLGGQATANSGLLGSIRFRTTGAFSGTTLRLIRAELGRGEEREVVTFDNTNVTLQLAALTADFNGDEIVDLGDFLLFVEHLGFSRGDERYDAKYDLDGDGTIGFGDFLIFGRSFGKEGA